jgi:hypothetical protein
MNRKGNTMHWNYLELHDYEPRNKHGVRELEAERQDARERGYTLITHELTNCYPDKWGELTFDQIIIRDYDTGKVIAVYEDDQMDEANEHYKEGNFWHAECFMP